MLQYYKHAGVNEAYSLHSMHVQYTRDDDDDDDDKQDCWRIVLFGDSNT